MKVWAIRLAGFLAIVAILWIGLTVWVEMEGPPKVSKYATSNDLLEVLIVYDPDPIYNLDEQICDGIAKGLNDEQVGATVATVKAAAEFDLKTYDCVVLCANTYNWSPDAAITSFVKSNSYLKSLPVVAVTIGSGSTSASAKRFKDLIRDRGIELMNDHEWWLMRPNDESRTKEGNVAVAADQSNVFGQRLGEQLKARDHQVDRSL